MKTFTNALLQINNKQMKILTKTVTFIVLLVLIGCGTSKPYISSDKYDVLTGDEFNGASFQFFEIIDSEKEFNMLLQDDLIKKFVKKEDITNSNFILVNLGEKPTTGYTIEVAKLEELQDKVVVTLVENAPSKKDDIQQITTKPYCVVRIKSKKPLEIKTPE